MSYSLPLPLKLADTPLKTFSLARRALLQRKCACGGTPGPTGECESCRKKRLQRKGQNGDLKTQHDSAIPSIVHEVLRSPGQPLDGAMRAFMEPRFGHDFSSVRVHTDSRAAESARAVNALAYTIGSDVVFASGQYRPNSVGGRDLLAHELTHTIQQGNGDGHRILRESSVGDAAEREANAAAQVIKEGRAFRPAVSWHAHLARQPTDGGPTLTPAPTYGITPGAPGCKVDVRATHIGEGIVSRLPIWHTFLVYTDLAGTESYYRGGPGGSCSGVTTGQYGTIITESGRYKSDTIDWSPGAPSVTAADSPVACGKNSCFASQLSRINRRCTPYEATGPNSNTVAKTLLSKCGVPLAKPVTSAPGWGDPDL